MDRLYELMDWSEIEAVIYAEETHPRDILGAKVTPYGILIQAFFPDEEEVSVRVLSNGKMYPMEKQEEGFFAVLLRGRRIPQYELVPGGKEDGKGYKDPYNYPCQITEKEETRFGAGIWYDAYRKLGAHPMTIGGVSGVYFAVWAPNAIRASVVGEFNQWDGRLLQMNKLKSGIFELFVPGVDVGAIYKYELKSQSGMVYLKADPYGRAFEQNDEAASIVVDGEAYQWSDEVWMANNQKEPVDEKAIAFYECNLQEWAKKAATEDGINYRKIAEAITSYMQEMGYTHVEFEPVMEYPEDRTLGYEVCGYFAPTSRYGTPEDFMYLVDYMHAHGISIVIDFVASYFASGYSLLTEFDGTCLYEHLDPRKGIHPAFGTHIFNYGRPEVTSFLISAALFWAKEFHVDGIKVTDLGTMLYLDYGREFGQWIPNMYGSSENLEAHEFVKHLNSIVHKQTNMMTIAEETAGGWYVTGDLNREGLGFDLKWNNEWSEEFLEYMRMDPVYRGPHQDELTMSTVHAFGEKYIIGFGKDESAGLAGTLFDQMPGGDKEETAQANKEANLRLALGYMIAHPGKKLCRVSEEDIANAEVLKLYIKDLIRVYKENSAFFKKDVKQESFEWISNLDAERNLLVFLRKTEKKEDTLLVICNFSNVAYEDVRVGVPAPGKYKEIFNSDAQKYGGSGVVNPRVKMSRAIEADERPDSIKVVIPPLGISIYKVSEVAPKTTNKAAKSAKRRLPNLKVEEKKEEVKKVAKNLKKELEDKIFHK